MENLSFFDCKCFIGRRDKRVPFEKHDVTSLLEEMEYFGMAEALVTHHSSITRPTEGNHRLLDEIGGHPNLHACWVLLPDCTGEMSEPGKLIEEMLERGVRAVSFFPAFHEFDLDRFSCGKLLNLLNKHRVPAFIASAGIRWKDVRELADDYPDIPLILSGFLANCNRHWYPLLERSENILIDQSRYFLHRGIEEFCRTFSSRRLLFGTNYPRPSMASSMGMVGCAEIDEKDKRLIAGDNLRNLIQEVRHRTRPRPAPKKNVVPLTEKLKDYCRGETVIDVHGHIGTGPRRKTPEDNPEGVMKVMDALGIDTMYFSLLPQSTDADYKTCNDLAIEIAGNHPKRLKAYMMLLPGNYPEELEEELSRCYRDGVKGIKIYPPLDHKQRPLSDSLYDPVWEFASSHGLPVLAHSDGSSTAHPANFDRIAEDFPRVKFIIGHFGAPGQSFYAAIDTCEEIMRKRSNVFVDLSGIWLSGPVEEVTKKLDTNRILFGTDATWHPMSPVLSMLVTARLSDEDKKKILGLNAKQMFGT